MPIAASASIAVISEPPVSKSLGLEAKNSSKCS